MIHTDTIAAIATAMGNSGIGIVRISGQEAVAVADRIFKEKGKQETLEGSPSHTIHYGYIYDGGQGALQQRIRWRSTAMEACW